MNSVITLRTLAGALCTAAIASMATIASAAMPPTSAGSLDSQFGNGGVARFQRVDGVGTACIRPIVQADGKIVAIGQEGRQTSKTYVVRFNQNGTIDSGFGAAGVAIVAVDASHYTYGLDIDAK